LSTLQSLHPDLPKIRSYFANEKLLTDFYYITRDTQDPNVGLRSRGIYYTSDGEDPGTGAAAGCTASWMGSLRSFPGRPNCSHSARCRDQAPKPNLRPR
jgi:predicted PhzF superfamily epimerase YddE/YHI9